MIGATISSVQETAAEAITKLIYTYAERIDAGDFAGVAEVFAHATLTFEGFGDAVTGREAIEALYDADHPALRGRDAPHQARHDQRDGRRGRRRRDGVEPLLLHRAAGRAGRAGPAAGDRRPLPAHLRSGSTAAGAVATMHITIDLVGDLGHHMLFDLAP